MGDVTHPGLYQRKLLAAFRKASQCKLDPDVCAGCSEISALLDALHAAGRRAGAEEEREALRQFLEDEGRAHIDEAERLGKGAGNDPAFFSEDGAQKATLRHYAWVVARITDAPDA